MKFVHPKIEAKRIPQGMRKRVFAAKEMECYICGIDLVIGDNATLDHIIPQSLGGENVESNLIPCCRRCNGTKGSGPASTLKMRSLEGAIENFYKGVRIPSLDIFK